MKKALYIVALLLLTGLTKNAAAAENGPKNASIKAKQVDAYLDRNGFNSPRIKYFQRTLKERMEGHYLRLGEERFEAGRVVLFYEVQPQITSKQIQLRFQPDNSNFEYTATPRSMWVNYKFTF